MLVLSVWFWFAWFRDRTAILERPWLLRALFFALPLGFVGLEAGWFVTEVGRQPWIIQGVLRTDEAITPASGVAPMFILFLLLYLLLGVTVARLLRRMASSQAERLAK